MAHVNKSRQRLSDRFSDLGRAVQQLAERLGSGQANQANLEELRARFEELPLTTAEFGLANVRLDNASRSYAAGDHHVAAYEIKLLRGLTLEK